MKVFISHSSTDKKFVRKLKNCLIENSIDTWIDEDQLDFGDSLLDKLTNAIDETSHLVIILSPASIKSDWVKLELNKAINNINTGLMSKIIPVLYRSCSIPTDLADLIYADLSNEIVLPDGNEIKFISDGFEPFFLKLVRAIRNTAKIISKNEKEEIIESLNKSEDELRNQPITIYRGIYKLNGFGSNVTRKKWQELIFNSIGGNEKLLNIRPLLLPYSTKDIVNPKIGEKFIIEGEKSESYGYFAGFRKDNLAILIDKRSRDECLIELSKYYQIEIDGKNSKIKFVARIA